MVVCTGPQKLRAKCHTQSDNRTLLFTHPHVVVSTDVQYHTHAHHRLFVRTCKSSEVQHSGYHLPVVEERIHIALKVDCIYVHTTIIAHQAGRGKGLGFGIRYDSLDTGTNLPVA